MNIKFDNLIYEESLKKPESGSIPTDSAATKTSYNMDCVIEKLVEKQYIVEAQNGTNTLKITPPGSAESQSFAHRYNNGSWFFSPLPQDVDCAALICCSGDQYQVVFLKKDQITDNMKGNSSFNYSNSNDRVNYTKDACDECIANNIKGTVSNGKI